MSPSNTAIVSARSIPLVDQTAVVEALRLIVGDNVTEIRCLNASTKNSSWRKSTNGGYFNDFDAAARDLSKLQDASGIYFVLNPVDPALLARAANRIKQQDKGGSTSDSHITARRWLPIDCDASRPSGISASDAEHEAAVDRVYAIKAALSAEGWPDPIVADSGNGGHLLYAIDLPVDDEGLVKRSLEALATRFDDDRIIVDCGVFNPACIWKLYGTKACKGDDTPERPHRMSKLISSPPDRTIVTRDQLEALAGPAEKPVEKPRRRSTRAAGTTFDVEGFIEQHGLEVSEPTDWNGGKLWTFRQSPLCDHHDDGPFLLQLANGALKAECKHDSCSWTWQDLRERFEPIASRGYRPPVNDPAEGQVTPRALTDLGNGERFAARYGDCVRDISAWDKWLVWDGRRWRLDDTHQVMRFAKLTAKAIHGEAAIAEDEDDQKLITKHAMASQGRARLEAMLALAKSEPPIATTHEGLDADPWLLNCENGTVDLRTGELLPHDPGDLITKTTGIDYADEPGVDAVLWEDFLHTTFAGDAELIRFVKRLVGVGLVGEQLEHLFPILWGGGANGKSVFTGAIQHALGDYAITAAPGLFTVKRGETHPTELADLHGRRLVVLNETQDGARLNEGLIKSISGGDTIKARRMREDFWQFPPSHLPMLVTNHKPVVSGTDFGIWRRLRLIPFTVTIPPERQDRNLPAKLRAEGPAILRWMVEGCLDWKRSGLGETAAVKAATDGYQAESDVLGRWLEECCVMQGSAVTAASQLLQSYNDWASTVHEREQSATWLGRRLSEKHLTKSRSAEGVTYRGIGLLRGSHA